jgi:hypothetical protein
VKEDPPQVKKGRRNAVFFLAAGLGLATAARMAPFRAGVYGGACYKCACCYFQGDGDKCSECGHGYHDHYRQTCLSSLERRSVVR